MICTLRRARSRCNLNPLYCDRKCIIAAVRLKVSQDERNDRYPAQADSSTHSRNARNACAAAAALEGTGGVAVADRGQALRRSRAKNEGSRVRNHGSEPCDHGMHPRVNQGQTQSTLNSSFRSAIVRTHSHGAHMLYCRVFMQRTIRSPRRPAQQHA